MTSEKMNIMYIMTVIIYLDVFFTTVGEIISINKGHRCKQENKPSLY